MDLYDQIINHHPHVKGPVSCHGPPWPTMASMALEALVFSSSLSAIDVLLQQIQRRKDRPCALKIIGNVAPEQRQA